jgi:hydrogenase expression/formation protein HypE
MRVGKLTPQELRELVLGRLGAARREILTGAGVGLDAAVLDPGGRLAVLTTDPITGAGHDAGWLAVHVSANDLAACGAEPVAILLTIMAPPGATPADIAGVMEGADRAARLIGAAIAGGHTEVVPAVNQMVVVAAATGLVSASALVRNDGGRPGDALVMTKWAGLEGTAILATDFAAELEAALVERARGLSELLSVVPEGRLAAGAGATAMHDATEGGILGAVYEMAEACGCGALVDAARIPVLPETSLICGHFGLDPLRLIASGSMLIACPDGPAMAGALVAAGICATVIGGLTDPSSGRHVLVAGRRAPLEAPASDELWKVRTR